MPWDDPEPHEFTPEDWPLPGCSVPDCEYAAVPGPDQCYCHSRGFNPPLSFERYQALLTAEEVAAYRIRLQELEANAARSIGQLNKA